MNSERACGLTVLVVAHGPDDGMGFCSHLREAGYEVRYTPSIAEGMAFLDHYPIEFVIVSQGTAAFEGKSVLERAIKINRRLPVLVLTRSIDMKVYLEAMQLGALDYLETPIPAGLIVRSVRAHILKSDGPLAGQTPAMFS